LFLKKEVSHACQGCIYLIPKYSKHNTFIPVMQCCIFSIINPVFSVTWSFRNPINML